MERDVAPPVVLVMLSAAPYAARAAAVSSLVRALRLSGRVGLWCLEGDDDETLSPQAAKLLRAVRADESARRKAGRRRLLFRHDAWPPSIPHFEEYPRDVLIELVLWCLEFDIYLEGRLVISAEDYLHNVWVHAGAGIPLARDLAILVRDHPGTFFPVGDPALD